MEIQDSKIIAIITSGDSKQMDKVFAYLYEKHYLKATGFILSNNGTEEDAADVFQDAIVVLYEQIKKGRFKGNSTLKTYLFSIVRYQWLNKLKSKKPSTPIEEKYDFADEADTQELKKSEDIKRVLAIIDRMDDTCSNVLKSYYLKGHRMQEIQEQFNLGSEQAAKNKKYRCMKKLMELIKKESTWKKV